MRMTHTVVNLVLIFLLAACQEGGGTKPDKADAEPKQPVVVDLGRNHFGTVTGIPCGDSRTSTYTRAQTVAVVVDKTCTNGSVKIEVTPRRGQAKEYVEHAKRTQTGSRPKTPAKAGDATVVDVPAGGKLTITCDGGTAGDCAVRIKKGRGRRSQGQNYSMVSNHVQACGTTSDGTFRNFSGMQQSVEIVFQSVCGRGAMQGRPAPLAETRTMGTATANPGVAQSAAARFVNGKWKIDVGVPSGQAVAGIGCKSGPSQCKYSVKVKK